MTEFLTWNQRIVEQPHVALIVVLCILLFIVAALLISWLAGVVEYINWKFFRIGMYEEAVLDAIDEEEREWKKK